MGDNSEASRLHTQAYSVLNEAWDLYYVVFRKINKQLPAVSVWVLIDCCVWSRSLARDAEGGITWDAGQRSSQFVPVSFSVSYITGNVDTV